MSHRPVFFAHRLTSLGRTVFRHNRIEAICPEKPVPTSRPSTLSSLPCRSFPSELSPSYFPQFPFRPPFHPLPCRSFPSDLSPSYFPRFPFRPPSRCFRIGSPALCSPAIFHPPCAALPQLFPRVGPTGTIAFMEFVLKTRCQKLCILVSLPPYAALPQLFPTLPTQLSPSYFHVLDPQFFRNNRIDGKLS